MLPARVTRRLNGPLATRWSFDPFRQLEQLAEDMFADEPAFNVRVDVREDESFYYIDAEVPGFKREEIDVTFEDGLLLLTGERKREEARKGENWHVTERAIGKFSRSFRMPSGVDQNKVEASLKEGVLTVRLPKTDEVKPRRIEVKG